MAATPTCRPQVQACAIRVARLDTSGVPWPGTGNLYVSDALSKLTVTPVYTDGDEIKEKNACGSVKINYKGKPSFDRADWELELLTPDPQLIDLMTNSDAISTSTSYGGNAPPIGEISDTLFSLEVWSRQILNGVPDPTFPWAWWVFPMCKNARWGAIPFENGAKKIVITGEMYENTNWFNGPTNDWPGTSDRTWQWLPSATIPTPACGPSNIAST